MSTRVSPWSHPRADIDELCPSRRAQRPLPDPHQDHGWPGDHRAPEAAGHLAEVEEKPRNNRNALTILGLKRERIYPALQQFLT